MEILKKNFTEFSQNKKIEQHARNVAGALLESRGDATLEAQEAAAVATAAIWEKLESEKIEVPPDLRNPDGYWMAHYKQHIKHYMLKRYARRSNRKSRDQYEKELAKLESTAQKPSKYDGARFEVTKDEELVCDGVGSPESLHLNSDDEIRAQFEELGLKSSVIDLLMMRAEGLTYKEIGVKLGDTEDTVRQRLNRAVKRARLTRSQLF